MLFSQSKCCLPVFVAVVVVVLNCCQNVYFCKCGINIYMFYIVKKIPFDRLIGSFVQSIRLSVVGQ